MARGGGKKDQHSEEAEERKRRKRIAFSKNVLSEAPANVGPSSVLSPSKTVIKHHGKDILRKSQRGKNRYLFSFPGLLAPVSGGKIGELKDLGTKNPILYLDFPQGQMKLFGTIVYPRNRYLTLQFSRGGKNVICDDYFDAMIVFSDAWWIGRKDENPKELRLEFPNNLNVGEQEEYDFNGGAGTTSKRNRDVNRSEMRCVEYESPKNELEDDLSDSQNNLKELTENTPTRHSRRTAGKRFHFAEASSGDDSAESDDVISDRNEKKVGAERPSKNYTPGKTETSFPVVFEIDNECSDAHCEILGQFQDASTSERKSKELSSNSNGSLVQATISTLFKKAGEKVPKNQRNSSAKVSDQNLQHMDVKRKPVRVKAKGTNKKDTMTNKGTGRGSKARKHHEVEDADDDIEEFTSTSQDTNGSDVDWAA